MTTAAPSTALATIQPAFTDLWAGQRHDRQRARCSAPGTPDNTQIYEGEPDPDKVMARRLFKGPDIRPLTCGFSAPLADSDTPGGG